MAETVFTISGAMPAYADLGDDAAPAAPMVPAPQAEQTCAQQVMPLVGASVVCGLGGIGAGVFGVYKAGQRRTGASLFGFASAIGLWMLGSHMMRGAVQSFEACGGGRRP